MTKHLTKSKWKWIPDYEGHYKISDYGEVKSVGRFIITKSGVRRYVPTKIIKPKINKYGYKTVGLRKKGILKHYTVHTLVLRTFIGPRPLRYECRHLDGNPMNNHLQNLKWGSRKENAEDMVAHGRCPSGEDHYAIRLTQRKVNLIRARYKFGETAPKLALEYNVSSTTIYDIVKYKTWFDKKGFKL